jgi:hypothetical protein
VLDSKAMHFGGKHRGHRGGHHGERGAALQS